MSLLNQIIEKAKASSEQAFQITNTDNLNDYSQRLDTENSLVTNATILCVSIKNMPFLIKAMGKRSAAKSYKLFGIAMNAFAAETHGFLVNHHTDKFILLYPSSIDGVNSQVRNALRLNYILSKGLLTQIPALSNTDFSIGMDYGSILCIKENKEVLWFGECIDKAITIGENCHKPSRVGISGRIYQNIDEETRTHTKHFLGIARTEESWERNGYQFLNEHKHFYSTPKTIEVD